jgi:hypothetical protein
MATPIDVVGGCPEIDAKKSNVEYRPTQSSSNPAMSLRKVMICRPPNA